MYKFECKDLGMDCNFAATGNSADEVKTKAIAHAQKAHPDVVKSTPMTSLEKSIVGATKKTS